MSAAATPDDTTTAWVVAEEDRPYTRADCLEDRGAIEFLDMQNALNRDDSPFANEAEYWEVRALERDVDAASVGCGTATPAEAEAALDAFWSRIHARSHALEEARYAAEEAPTGEMPCCNEELRTIAGGCSSCGDPSF